MLQRWIAELPPRPDAAALVAGFVPPPRFAAKRFDSYRPDPNHPSQAAALATLRGEANALHAAAKGGMATRLRRWLGGAPPGVGAYLDGGFGVGKTHLLAALWHAAPPPKAYLSFDELVYTVGLLGVEGAREAFRQMRLVAVDEWELDDPGNLKLALAWLRGAVAGGARVAATSNTVPDELGRGRFSQKSFAAEIEELVATFRTVRMEGEDFRHRRFARDSGTGLWVPPAALGELKPTAGRPLLRVDWDELRRALAAVHPIRYAALVERVGALAVDGIEPLAELPGGLRWVHWVDKLYDGAVPLAASSGAPLGSLFPAEWVRGPYGKKFGRCLSRMEELLAEGAAAVH